MSWPEQIKLRHTEIPIVNSIACLCQTDVETPIDGDGIQSGEVATYERADWRPMDTAPHDTEQEVPILVWVRKVPSPVGGRVRPVLWNGRKWHDLVRDIYWSDDDCVGWRPLPEPKKDA